jgi:hypothetical protein
VEAAGTQRPRRESAEVERSVNRRESFYAGLVKTKNLEDSVFLTIRSIRTKAWVKTRIEHAGASRMSVGNASSPLTDHACRLPIASPYAIPGRLIASQSGRLVEGRAPG